VVQPPRASGKRKLLVQHGPEMGVLAKEAARLARGHKSLFFCQSRSMTEAVAGVMRQAGTEVFVHHSSVSREERQRAEEKFYRGQDACIVCTSTLELGIDVGDLDLVLQAEAPDTVSAFLQRMGRTGRREGQTANTSFFCETREGMVQALALIELAKAGWVEPVNLQDRCWPVLLHQLLAMSLAEGGITLERAWEHLSKVPDFSGIHRPEFERLVRWMLRDGSLVLATGRLVLGPKAEKRFGRRNFMDLYAVFSSPQTYTVQTPAGQPLGSLSQGFVDRLTDGLSHFLLGGRAWSVVHINHKDRILQVEPAPAGSQPTWGGFLPQFIGREVCEAILGWLASSDKDSQALTPQAREALAEWRAEASEVLEPGRGGLQASDREISWWTFAGGRINSTLRSALAAVGGDWKISADNFRLRVQGEHVDERTFKAALERLDEPDFWLDEKLWAEVAEGLPSYRLSKFQPLMPPWVEREVLASYLLDLEGARRWWGDHRELPSLRSSPTQAARVPLPRADSHEATTDEPPPVAPASLRQPSLPVRWVSDDEGLARMCAALAREAALALDVETQLYKDLLCLVQMASRAEIYIVDALEISDWTPLARLMGDGAVVKVIHNAAFERRILAQHDIQITHVFDTLPASRKLRPKAEGGHGLGVVCAREFGQPLDKAEQKSDWRRRPLTDSQRTYAALDVDVLLPLYDKFRAELDALGQTHLL
jgi:ATP-dependent Lhr-like helicase